MLKVVNRSSNGLYSDVPGHFATITVTKCLVIGIANSGIVFNGVLNWHYTIIVHYVS